MRYEKTVPGQFTGIPTYLAGPLQINGQCAAGSFTIPLATNEKPLVAGVARGCKAANLCGGVETAIIHDEMTRAPLFLVKDMRAGLSAFNYINNSNNFYEFAKITDSTTRYGKLNSLTAHLVGDNLYIRIGMFCGDAAGHNMTTKAATGVARFLEKKFSCLELLSISSNYCTDKKASAINPLSGRGKKVVAYLMIPQTICEQILKTSPKAIYELNIRKNLLGSIAAGSICSANAHYANMLAATYLATGQDISNIVEGSQGITTASIDGDSLLFSVNLPSIIVGTVGGGTQMPDQAKNLQLLGCYGTGNPVGTNAKKLAEIIAATVLVGELSLMACLTKDDELIRVHEFLERKKD